LKFKTSLVFGAGAFGTSIASVLADNFAQVIILVRNPEVYASLKNQRENIQYLPGIKLPANIIPALSWEEAESLANNEIELIVSGLPTNSIKNYCEENYERLKKYLIKGVPFVSLSKGMNAETLELADEIFYHHFLDFKDNFCYLSGPSFAKEIVDKQITAVSLAGRSRDNLEKVMAYMQTPYFKTLPSYDVKGVLLGGSLKNLLAIGGGIVEGLGFNHNTTAAMITYGINEMLRFGVVYNARPETFYGLSGMGDLILTVTGHFSRNKSFGIEISKGRKPEDIIKSQRTTVEGYKTTKAAYLIAEKYQIRARVTKILYGVLYENKDPLSEIHELMKVPSRFQNII
jgi:glycerol-3-phosphate dehydrogenase (NAD(P)+)